MLLFALGMGLFFHLGQEMENPLRSTLGLIPIGLAILSLVLVNAQGVTSITSERDTGALDLLLVSELSPKEFIYGKLYGVLYNSKEMIALPVLTAIAMFVLGIISGENLVLFLIDFLLLCHFAAMLGLHAAITYTSSRTAVANSLATIFFLMIGILLVCVLDRAQQSGVRPPTSQLHDLHRGRQRGAVWLPRSQKSVPCDRAGRTLDPVLDVLLHHQPGQRRHHGRVLSQRGHLWLCHTRDAGSRRRRLRYRSGTHQRDPGLTPLFPTVVGKTLARRLTWRSLTTAAARIMSAKLVVSACAAVAFGLLPSWPSCQSPGRRTWPMSCRGSSRSIRRRRWNRSACSQAFSLSRSRLSRW